MEMSEYNIKIIKALNGYVVFNNQDKDEIFLVNEEEHLGNAIMAALVSQKLAGTQSKNSGKLTTSEIDDLLYEKSKWEAERRALRDELQNAKQREYQYGGALGQRYTSGTAAQSSLANDNAYDAKRYAMMAQSAGLAVGQQEEIRKSILDALRDNPNPPLVISKKKGIV
jgi:predicted  nucleic acid-binding Zn-ribbon protein